MANEQRKERIFTEIDADADVERCTEVESLCMNCGENVRF
jgi:hypothetical protein